jgi:putative ABC transport system substrate-binding protein
MALIGGRVNRRELILLLIAFCAAPIIAEAQQVRTYRVGVILLGGSYSKAIDGLRDGLGELGLEEGKQLIFHVRDVKGDLKAVEASARSLEGEKVDLIFALATSVAIAAMRATKSVPIMFYGGTDPVAVGLVKSLRKPAGRVTGIYGQSTDLAGKRLQLLTQIIPNLRRVVTFYNPGNPTSRITIAINRDAARKLKVELIERQVTSVDGLKTGLRALRPREADAFLYGADAMIASQAGFIIETAMEMKLPTMFADNEDAAKGALVTYGVSFNAIGRLAARNIHRILLGADPGDLPVEQVDRLYLVINLKTAKVLGLAIPQPVLARADEIIQ